jgi:hypothetical protein
MAARRRRQRATRRSGSGTRGFQRGVELRPCVFRAVVEIRPVYTSIATRRGEVGGDEDLAVTLAA